MLEKKNIRILDDVLESFRGGQGEHKQKQGNEYNVTDLLGCRKKLDFKRLGIEYKFVESDFSRQGKIANFVHSAIQVELRKMGWETEKKFTKEFGKYELHCRVDGVCYTVLPDFGTIPEKKKAKKLIEIKVPMYNSVAKSGIPDYYMLQIGMYLNITGAQSCTLMVLAKNGFSEKVITDKLSDEDILWIIEEGAQIPWFPKECDNCYYSGICDI